MNLAIRNINLQDDKIKELIHVIVDTICKNATIDLGKREDVRAKLRLTAKKYLGDTAVHQILQESGEVEFLNKASYLQLN